MSSEPRSLDEAVASLRRDPTHPVRATVEGMTLELRTVDPGITSEKTLAEALREIGPWEGETHDELVAIFADIRRRSSRSVPTFDE